MNWTKEAIDTLTGLWVKHNWSATQIAALFAREGCTRNAVIGKVNRLGLCRSKKNTRPLRPLEIENAALVGEPAAEVELNFDAATFVEPVKTSEPKPKRHVKPKPAVIAPASDLPPEPAPIAACGPVTIFELLPHHCRWIDGQPDGAATLYCGSTAAPGSSYCEHHATAAGGGGTANERRALYFAKRSHLTGANT